MSNPPGAENALSGLRILVTRPQAQARELAERLEQAGARPVLLPLIEIEEPEDRSALDDAIRSLDSYDWIIFASANAARSFLDRVAALNFRMQAGSIKTAAIGDRTAQALRHRGFEPDFVPSSFIAEALVAEFPGYPHLRHLKILWPRTNVGRLLIKDELENAGARVHTVTCYRTGMPGDQASVARRLQELLDPPGIDVVTLTSSQAVRNLATLLSSRCMPAIPEGLLIAVIGPQTAQTAVQCLGRVDVQAGEHTIDGLLQALSKHILQMRESNR